MAVVVLSSILAACACVGAGTQRLGRALDEFLPGLLSFVAYIGICGKLGEEGRCGYVRASVKKAQIFPLFSVEVWICK